MQAVILCGGMNRRMGVTFPKTLLTIGTTTPLAHVVEFWRGLGVTDFLFLTGHYYQIVEPYIQSLPIKYRIVRGDGLMSFALDIYKLKQYTDRQFVINLGDCLQLGKFENIDTTQYGVGVTQTDEKVIQSNYAVTINSGKVERLFEHPNEVPHGSLCGMGTFILGTEIFDAIRQLQPSKVSTRVEFIEAIQLLIDQGIKINPIKFTGKYLNVNTPEELKLAQELIKEI